MDREKIIDHLNECLKKSSRRSTWTFVRKDIIKDTLAILKEREPVEPDRDIVRNRRCPKCFTILKGKFCHECGQAVKWE